MGLGDWKDECAFARTRTVTRDFRFWKEDAVCILDIRFDVENHRIKEKDFHKFTSVEALVDLMITGG